MTSPPMHPAHAALLALLLRHLTPKPTQGNGYVAGSAATTPYETAFGSVYSGIDQRNYYKSR